MLLALLASCRAQDGNDGPNLVVVTIDTLRADRLGTYGYFRDTTPALDALARESLVFERCFAPMATTFPSHLSLFTGTYPNENGAIANVGVGGLAFQPTGSIRTLAQLLQEAGYRTAAFVSATPLKRFSGISAGFDEFQQPKGQAHLAEVTNAHVLAWLATENTSQPFFMWVHYYDPHGPYNPPAAFARKYKAGPELDAYFAERNFSPSNGAGRPTDVVNNRYDGEVSYVDHELGRLLDTLRADREVWDNTIVVVVADHGEGLRQHGELRHGGVWREQLQVPLIMRIPGRDPARTDQIVSVADILPTLMGMVELPGKDALRRQASGVDRFAQKSDDPLVFSQESSAPWKVGPEEEGPRYVLTGEEWKYIYESKDAGRLFHLSTDPHELDDVSRDHPEIAERLRAILLHRLEAQKQKHAFYRATLPSTDTEDVDPTILEQLRSLGYVP